MARALQLLALLAAFAAPAEEVAPSPILGADLHAHPTMHWTAYPVFQGYPGGKGVNARRAEDADNRMENQLDGAELKQNGIRVVLASIWPPFALSPNRTSLDQTVHQLHVLRRWAQRQKDFALAETPEEAQRALKEGHVVLIPVVEGGEMLTGPEDVDTLYAAGARMITLEHMAENDLGGAAGDQLRRSLTRSLATHPNQQGLTPLGRKVVERMMQKGMIIDLAHSSDQTLRDVLDLTASRQVPLLYSHGASRELSGGERNLPDDLAKAIAERGGLIGITLYREYTSHVPETEQWPGYVPGTCDDEIAHWLHLVKVVGPEALSLGSDFNGFITRPLPGGDCPNGIRGSQDLGVLWTAMEKRGVPRAAFDSSGPRLLAVWARVLQRASP